MKHADKWEFLWAGETKVFFDGKEMAGVTKSTYLTVTGIRSKGVITIEFPMQARFISGNPKIEETFNQIAVKRGPILYTLEEIDLPEGVSIDEIVVPMETKFKPLYDAELLNGVTILEGPVKYFESQNWDKTMYQEFKKPEFKELKLKIIPYYTWANRGAQK